MSSDKDTEGRISETTDSADSRLLKVSNRENWWFKEDQPVRCGGREDGEDFPLDSYTSDSSTPSKPPDGRHA